MELEDETDMPVSECSQLTVFHSEHVPAVYEHLALGGPVQCTDYLKQGGFTRTGLADDGYNLPLLHLQVHPLQHFQFAERLIYITYLYHLAQFSIFNS